MTEMPEPRTLLKAPSAADVFLRDIERRAEHPDASSTIGAVLHVTGAVPQLSDLQQHVAARLFRLPCMEHLLHGDGKQAQWVHAVPDPAHHVSARRVGKGPQALETAVLELAREPWLENVPAWRLVLLHGHVADGFALLYLTHHAVQDGGTVAMVLEALFGPDRPAEPSTTVLRSIPAGPRPRLLQVLRSTAVLVRHLRKHHLWTSPSQPLSSRRRTLWAQVPAAVPRVAARASGASMNDVFLTALGHAITQWASTAWPRRRGSDPRHDPRQSAHTRRSRGPRKPPLPDPRRPPGRLPPPHPAACPYPYGHRGFEVP
ncbi:wax ester/triacylglycerol synthase domain-containing protein [Streptomyces sp. YS415]|uniref:wax ester/triacylglycerol synthase domain-containing protein n=1 Tax=Streptomyces sp. YS415 TaxID=2944806 RepID=UPI0020209F29|nr:wax ester/triacylglycerol synthase domain-containing protein [Streptomyces sp. YS415]MCL7427123.1 hypothetical protein [Streptomyces sp. YS415]